MDEFKWSDPPSRFAFPIAAAGVPLIFAAAFSTLILALLGLTALAVIGLAATFAICGFFRDPDRVIPTAQGAVVSPADGKVIATALADDGPFFKGECRRVSIFMSVFNVHVNRIPAEGRVTQVRYRPGQFVAADRQDASGRNEHNAVFLETDDGRSLCAVQVAGLIARRIICRVQAGDRVLRGQRFGMICFGSRLDVYLPKEIRLAVAVGDRVSAGSTVLGTFETATGGM
ncbi:MAG: phosphatidylserine decarboxylase family protein [Desulfobacterales bacterium]|jgi:phosphatidylserine decarboxylase|nr:phosphatidylserine decarboxylase family protein [Desulfobacterales bacterium]